MSEITAIKHGLAQRAEAVAELLLPRGRKEGSEWRCGSLDGKAGQSLAVHLTGSKAGLWKDFSQEGPDSSGDLIDLWRLTTGMSLVEALDRARAYLGMERAQAFKEPKKTFKRPKKPRCTKPKGRALDYLREVRHISEAAITAYEVEELDNGSMLFPFLRDNELVMATSREPRSSTGPNDKVPCIPISKDFEHCLGGWQAIDPQSRVAYVTEGFIDAMSMYDYGYPALTVPMGGGTGKKQQWIENEFERMERFETIYLVLDNDEQGDLGAAEIAQRLGVHRCLRVLLPKKDANECLMCDVPRDQIVSAIAEARSLSGRNDIAPVGPSLICRRASEIEPEQVEWLWEGRIAVGKQTIIAGDPGTGKSQTSVAIAATISTRGHWPCGEGRAPLGNIIILSAEDGAADTIVPRLIAAGADLRRIHIVVAVRTEAGIHRGFNLQRDLNLLERKIAEIGDVRLIIIDPISSYLGKTDSYKNTDVRGVLEPIGEMAERLRVAVLSVTHFSKGSAAPTKALHKFIGSIAFVAAARAAFVVLEDNSDKDLRLLLHAKNNLAAQPQGLAFRLEQRIIGEGIPTSRIEWEQEPVGITADEVLSAPASSKRNNSAVEEAKFFLLELLADGPVLAKQVWSEADNVGLARATVNRAKKELGIKPGKIGMEGGWAWSLPAADLSHGGRCSH